MILPLSFFLMTTSNSLSQQNVWFSVSIGLMGLILGYSVATMGRTFTQIGEVGLNPPSVPNVPAAPTGGQANAPATPVDEIDPIADHLIGPKDAKVTFVEYMDYECPFCKRHYDTMKQLRAQYKDDVNFAMRHFPLDFHPNAMPEALAAECVGELGGSETFWKFSDLIMERTTAGGTGFALADLPALAKEVGVNEAKFKTCFDAQKYASMTQEEKQSAYSSEKYFTKIQTQQQHAVASGINGTPGNAVINNETKQTELVSGAQPLSVFTAKIDAMLGKN